MAIVVHGLGRHGDDATTVERSLAGQPGVLYAAVNPSTEVAYVVFDSTVCDLKALVTTIRRAGFGTGPPLER
jgi:hypothetical protein